MLIKNYLKGQAICQVTFILPQAITAQIASLAGDFNEWDTKAMPMMRNEQGLFTLTIELAAGREYQFRYRINDEEWYNDWNADRYTSNPFGGDNSVVTV